MRIVFLVHRYWPDVGGVERYVHRLAVALQEIGHTVRVVAGAHGPGMAAREVHEGVEVFRFPAYRSPARAWLHLMRLQPVFRWAEVIHVSNTHVLEYFYRMAAWTLPHRPVFLTRHGMSCTFPVPDSEKARARRSVEWVDGVVHDGCFIGKWLGVEPDVVPEQGLWPEADDVTPVPEPPPDSAVFVGRLDPDSGVDIYVDAIEKLRDCHGRTVTLHVYGGGSLQEQLQRKVERHRLPVVFHGRQPDAQERITDGCFAFVAGRMAMQEAMARRRLVVAAYANPLKRDYVCGETFSPHVVAGGSAEAIAAEVAKYASRDVERRQRVDAAFEYTRRLSWKETAAAYVDLWTRAATARPRFTRLDLVRLALQLRAEARDSSCRPQAASPTPIPLPV